MVSAPLEEPEGGSMDDDGDSNDNHAGHGTRNIHPKVLSSVTCSLQRLHLSNGCIESNIDEEY
jgi:hypothetical protein